MRKIFILNSAPRILLLEVTSEKDLPQNFNQVYHTHLYCHRGRANFLYKDKKVSCKNGDFLFLFAESQLTELGFSKGCKASVLLIEKDFLTNNAPYQTWELNATLYVREHPVNKVEKRDARRILSNFKWINNRFLENEHQFYEETLRLQLQLFILEMWHTFAKVYTHYKHSMQTGTLYERFIHLVKENCLTEREVQFYSNQLNITPKYLNYISKQSSGITASVWIQRYTREHIIQLLQNQNLNISEIADKMNFSTASFFTVYVKRVLGVTPKEYQKRFE